MTTERPSWDQYFMDIALVVASRSTCMRRKVGALLVRDRRILATGYNGAPSALDHCQDVGCVRSELNVPAGERHELCRGLHAEQNVIIQAAVHGVPVSGSKLYTTLEPCSVCAKMLINAGINEIVYIKSYGDLLARKLLEQAEIRVTAFPGDEA